MARRARTPCSGYMKPGTTPTELVARACASNPIAVATPCHRVVRSDGQAGGYRWGVARSQALLAREPSS